ncbi:MAG: anhydro-N-acetylmuramic acid kinase [Acidobacteriales bacterium]|nr:anhydro-N-acetylmuramic acid kinase [Terriglobales bacterium]
MIVAGVMSGTSADGIDVAVVRLLGRGLNTRFRLLAHERFPYPASVRRTVLEAMDARAANVGDLARLDFLLGELYAKAVQVTQKRSGVRKLDLVGCHGQTLFHQGDAAEFCGQKIAATWQIGQGSVIAQRLGVPVVSDFRPADMAAGGKGAPLVPFLDLIAYRHATRGRILQNIGGIGNLTAIPPKAKPEQVIAFDTGPGNMVIDACMESLFDRAFDRNGAVARDGRVLQSVIDHLLSAPYFQRKPPKTAGREQFGREFVREFLRRCGRAPKPDVIATATALTAQSIAFAVRRFVTKGGTVYRDFILAGGGAKNGTLLRMLKEDLGPLGLKVRLSDEMGVPADAKEAIAFAVLAYQTWHRLPGNVPSATGADRAVILGKISHA